MDYIARTLDGPEYYTARLRLLSHHGRTRVIDRCVCLALTLDPGNIAVKTMALRRAEAC